MLVTLTLSLNLKASERLICGLVFCMGLKETGSLHKEKRKNADDQLLRDGRSACRDIRKRTKVAAARDTLRVFHTF